MLRFEPAALKKLKLNSVSQNLKQAEKLGLGLMRCLALKPTCL